MGIDTHAEWLRTSVVEDLEELGYYNNEGYTLMELKDKLDAARAMEREVKNPGNDW